MSIPLLSDLPAVRHQYMAGDCLIVRVTTAISPAQHDKIRKYVQKFAGADVSVAVVNTVWTQLLLTHPNGDSVILTPEVKMTEESKLGVANLNLSKVPFQAGDRLLVRTRISHRKSVEDYFKNWAAHKQVEIFVEIVDV